VTKSDIKDYYRYWYELFPSGDADKHQFKKYAEDILSNAAETNTDYLFRAMDSNKYDIHHLFIPNITELTCYSEMEKLHSKNF
jgi:hypothetical protein